MDVGVAFCIGAMVGLILGAVAIGFFLERRRAQDRKRAADTLSQDRERAADTFKSMALEQLDGTKNNLLKAANEKLEEFTKPLDKLKEATSKLEGAYQDSAIRVTSLGEKVGELSGLLGSNQARGGWAEQQVMQLIGSMGLIEDVDYTRQDKSSLSDDSRPDFTFRLPDKKVVNLDVKFPWANYAKYLESEGEDEEQRVRVKKDFYRDVRNHINAVHERGYANPQGGTVDFALIYIPNEGVFRTMHLDGENQVFEEAMKKKIVLCSPITLYAILSMIRQAVENFNLSEKAGEIQKHFLEFRKQWDNYSGKVEALGRDLRLAQGKYDEIVGVRERQLMKPVENILTTNVETLED
jgi:DNA recombination protein RmuC